MLRKSPSREESLTQTICVRRFSDLGSFSKFTQKCTNYNLYIHFFCAKIEKS